MIPVWRISQHLAQCRYFAVEVVLLLVFVGCKGKHQPQTPPVVEVARVVQRDVPIYDEWVGTLDGLVNARIRAQVSGYLLTQDYNDGSFVKKGELLFQIDPRPFQAALDIAKGQLAQAQAQQGKTGLDVKRFTPLAKENAISQQELDDAIQANLAAQAVVASAKAAVEQAELNLGFTKITTPVDGIVSIATAQIGDLVGPSTGDLTIVSTVDPIKVYFDIPEKTYIACYKKFLNQSDPDEMELGIILVDGSIFPHKGKVFAVGRHVNPNTGTIRVEATFPNPGNILRPGQFSRVRAKLEVKKGAILVPQRAVNETQGSCQIAVVDSNNQIEIRPVTAGRRIDNLWVIDGGLKPDDRIVVEGVSKVNQGMVVTPRMFVTDSPKESASPGK